MLRKLRARLRRSTGAIAELLAQEVYHLEQAAALRKLRAALERGSTAGELGATLGLRAVTPCCTVQDPAQRRAVREWIAVAALGPRPRGADLCHRCDDCRCVAADHLFWGSRRDNVRDMCLKRRHWRQK